MKIQLNHVQRLNLHALLGAQRGDVATIRALWALQDMLALTPEEEQAIELKREFVAGTNALPGIPRRRFPPRNSSSRSPKRCGSGLRSKPGVPMPPMLTGSGSNP